MDNNQTSPIKIRKMVANADRKETAPEIIFVVIGASFGSFFTIMVNLFYFSIRYLDSNIRNNYRNNIFKNYRLDSFCYIYSKIILFVW